MSLKDRFWAKVDSTGECWIWTASTDNHGYGQINIKTDGSWRPQKAHRVSLILDGVEIPAGFDVDHICRNRLCVRPSHLRVVTRKQNMENAFGVAGRHGSSGLRGVYWNKTRKKWAAQIGHAGKTTYLGLFESKDEANQAVLAARMKLYTHNTYERGEACLSTH